MTRARREQVFAIDIAAYAIRSNHYHLVLHINETQVIGWSDREVIERWLMLFSGPPLIRRHLAGEELTESEWVKVAEIVADWRDRLSDLSWFMRCLNEHIARQANQEDGWTGRCQRDDKRGIGTDTTDFATAAYRPEAVAADHAAVRVAFSACGGLRRPVEAVREEPRVSLGERAGAGAAVVSGINR